MSKIFNYAWKGRYATEESEAAKVHKNFFKKLEQGKIPEDAFQEHLRFGTNLDRIHHVTEVFDFNDIVLNYKLANRYQKSSELAKEFREHGNELYKQRNFPDACRAYNLSIVFSPLTPSENELSLALGNRSALFFETKKIASSLRDIQRAKSAGYPPNILPKLLQREKKCCNLLHLDILSSDLQNVHYTDNLVKKEMITYSGDDENEEACRCRRKYCEEVLFRIQNQNEHIPVAEDFISIRSNSERGRHVITTKPVKPGTVLVVDEPYAKVLLDELKWDLDHCHHCHSKTNYGLPCPGCVFAIFCSEDCFQSAQNTYHKYECPCTPFLHILKPPRTLLLSFRIITTLGPEGLREFKMQSFNRPKYENEILGFLDGSYISQSYYPIHHLISHPDKCKTSELLSYSLTAITVIKILGDCSTFFQDMTDDPEFKIFAASLMLLHMQNLPCNAHSLNEMNLGTEVVMGTIDSLMIIQDRIRTVTNTEYGAGAFALLSLINHSCDPNVFRVNLHNGKTAVLTLTSLNPGDELLDNYGDHYALDELHSRQRALFQNYYFDCNCVPCANPETWPLLPELKSLPEVFICPTCAFYGSENGNPTRSRLTPDGNCVLCSAKFDLEKVSQELNGRIDQFFVAHEQVLGNEPLKALSSLTSCLEYFDTHLERPFIRVNETEETFKQALNLIVNSQ